MKRFTIPLLALLATLCSCSHDGYIYTPIYHEADSIAFVGNDVFFEAENDSLAVIFGYSRFFTARKRFFDEIIQKGDSSTLRIADFDIFRAKNGKKTTESVKNAYFLRKSRTLQRLEAGIIQDAPEKAEKAMQSLASHVLKDIRVYRFAPTVPDEHLAVGLFHDVRFRYDADLHSIEIRCIPLDADGNPVVCTRTGDCEILVTIKEERRHEHLLPDVWYSDKIVRIQPTAATIRYNHYGVCGLPSDRLEVPKRFLSLIFRTADSFPDIYIKDVVKHTQE